MKSIKKLRPLMRLLLLSTLLFAALSSCVDRTETETVKVDYTRTIHLPKGQRLVDVDFEKTYVWYLTEAMDSGYVPKTKYYRSVEDVDSVYTKVFIESK